jgi:hypothetical protein
MIRSPCQLLPAPLVSVVGAEAAVRDYGLLEAVLTRPQATVFGKDAYASPDAKAAALLHSLARSHALIDGGIRDLSHHHRGSWRPRAARSLGAC